MTDKDIIERAATLLDVVNVHEEMPSSKSLGKKVSYRFTLGGRRAAAWMMTLYGLLGERRQEAIRHALLVWRNLALNKPSRYSFACLRGHEFTPESTRWKTNSTRQCLICQKNRAARRVWIDGRRVFRTEVAA